MSNTPKTGSRFAADERASKGRFLRLFACLVALIATLASQPTIAGEHVSDDWQFAVNPYMWALAASGNATVKGTKSDVDLKFSDIWDALNIAAMVELQARKGRLGMFVHPLYAELE